MVTVSLLKSSSVSTKGWKFRKKIFPLPMKMKFNGEAIITAREMRAFFYESGLDSPLRKRVEELREWLLEGLKKAEKDEMEKPWVEDRRRGFLDRFYAKTGIN